jgi:hypothetical protein
MRQPTLHKDLFITLLVLLAVAAVGQHQARAAVLGQVLADPRLVDPAAALRIANALHLPTSPVLSATTRVPFSLSVFFSLLQLFLRSSSLLQAF